MRFAGALVWHGSLLLSCFIFPLASCPLKPAQLGLAAVLCQLPQLLCLPSLCGFVALLCCTVSLRCRSAPLWKKTFYFLLIVN
jgi:hypothetical protein